MIQLYKDEIKRLIDNIDVLKNEYQKSQKALKEKTDYQEKLELKVKKQEQIIEDIEEKYRILSYARSLGNSEKLKNDTKKRIDTLVREIDNCIALLNK